VPELVVDRLEVIEVEKQQRHLAPLGRSALNHTGALVEEGAPICNAGQRVDRSGVLVERGDSLAHQATEEVCAGDGKQHRFKQHEQNEAGLGWP
jgi:hypothetical protein